MLSSCTATTGGRERADCIGLAACMSGHHLHLAMGCLCNALDKAGEMVAWLAAVTLQGVKHLLGSAASITED